MAWGTRTQIATSLSVAGTELFSSDFTLNPGELAVVDILANFPASPTDNLTVSLYGTNDAAFAGDELPLWQMQISNATDPSRIEVPVSGLYRVRFGFVRTGSTDTITVDAWRMNDGVNL